eukprot:TRINITY_DN1291_c0_g5_i2.p1 TRINITY_DN1291_c0_g5~~TRINITY_DN1291_c0_g5_i2.p1  ORF type:complete len:313 (-),score=27.37 TRINITY_DN1291_c0_g5_i2:176-1114(-)
MTKCHRVHLSGCSRRMHEGCKSCDNGFELLSSASMASCLLIWALGERHGEGRRATRQQSRGAISPVGGTSSPHAALSFQVVEFGRIGMLYAELALLAHAMLDPDNQFLLLLSDSCIPIYPFPVVYDVISTSELSFVTNVACGWEGTWSSDLLPEIPRHLWHKGDSWKELHRALVLTILEDDYYFPKFRTHFGCLDCTSLTVKGFADEHYIPTVLHATRGASLANRTLTWGDWETVTDAFNPPAYKASDVTAEMLEGLRGKSIFHPFGVRSKGGTIRCRNTQGLGISCYLFARRFSRYSLGRLLQLAETVLGY